MAALAADRNTASRYMESHDYQVAANQIYKGSIVCLNAAGFLVPASDTAGLVGAVGVADENVDNSGGAAGDKSCRVISGRQFLFAATSIAQATLGDIMYAVDDQTFDEATGTNSIAVGFLTKVVSATSGWIFIPQGGIRAYP